MSVPSPTLPPFTLYRINCRQSAMKNTPVQTELSPRTGSLRQSGTKHPSPHKRKDDTIRRMYVMHDDLTAILYTWPAAPAKFPVPCWYLPWRKGRTPAEPDSAARQEPLTPSRELAFKNRDCAVQCQINTTTANTWHKQTSIFSLPFLAGVRQTARPGTRGLPSAARLTEHRKLNTAHRKPNTELVRFPSRLRGFA
jgi:hypothetical protein